MDLYSVSQYCSFGLSYISYHILKRLKSNFKKSFGFDFFCLYLECQTTLSQKSTFTKLRTFKEPYFKHCIQLHQNLVQLTKHSDNIVTLCFDPSNVVVLAVLSQLWYKLC